MSKSRDKSKEKPGQDVSSETEFGEKDVAALRTHAQLLQTFHHRNKNQHRRSPWWRHFDHFRRDAKAFVIEVEGAQATVNEDKPSGSSQKSKNKGKDEKLSIAERMQALKVERERIETRRSKCAAGMQKRKLLWSRALVATWYRSFSQLTADPQFAVMGLFLIAALSKVCGLLDIMPLVNEVDSEPPRALDDKNFNTAALPHDQDLRSEHEVDADDPELDIGTRIERAPSEEDSIIEAEFAPPLDREVPVDEQAKSRVRGSPPEQSVSTSTTGRGKAPPLVVPVVPAKAQKNSKTSAGLKRKDAPVKNKGSSKKSKKSGNAIDDLFSGLF